MTIERSRSCEICGNNFTPSYGGRTANQRTCGRVCGQALRASTLRAFTCERCGKAGAETAVGRGRRFCGDECRSWKPTDFASCAHCGTEFERSGLRQSCSSKCALALKHAYDRAYNATRTCAEWDRSNRICAHCGVAFSPTFVGQMYHDQACTRRARRKRERATGIRGGEIHRSRARKYGRAYEPISHIRVFERDGWVCQICLKRVPKNKKAPHPRSPSLDHIIPMSRPGGDHLYTNVRLAHLECNWRRGADDDSPVQLLLIG